MAKETFILSIDVGYNGFKTIVGARVEEGTEQLMKFHDAANIEKCNTNRKIEVAVKKDDNPLYVRAKNPVTKEEVNFIGGYPAKDRYEFTDELRIDDEFYDKEGGNIGGEYARFKTERFKMLFLATIFKALDKISGKSEELSKIMDDDNDFELKIMVELPHATLDSDDIKNSITSYIRNEEYHKNLLFSIDGLDDNQMRELPSIVRRAEIEFESQTYASITCEILNIVEEKLADKQNATDDERGEEFVKNLPAFAWDCGGKTVGIARVEEDASINSRSESNTKFAITNVCIRTADAIYDKFKIPQEKIEAYASAERVIEDYNEDGEPVTIAIAPIYKKQLKNVIDDLFDYSIKNYKREITTAKTFIVSGGAGTLYADRLLEKVKEAIAENFGEERAESKNYCKAKGKYGDVENGSIYSIATGGLMLA